MELGKDSVSGGGMAQKMHKVVNELSEWKISFL